MVPRTKSRDALGFQIRTRARRSNFTKQGDLYGWQKQFNGNWFLGLFVENGRIKDTPQITVESRRCAQSLKNSEPEMRLTPSQNIDRWSNVKETPNIEAINRNSWRNMALRWKTKRA